MDTLLLHCCSKLCPPEDPSQQKTMTTTTLDHSLPSSTCSISDLGHTLTTHAEGLNTSLPSDPSPRDPPQPAANLKELWKNSGLDQKVIENLIQNNQVPDELSKRIIRCILQAHHLEILVPLESETTNALDAALISFISTSCKLHKSKISLHAPTPLLTSPTVLVICLTTEKVERHCKTCKELGKAVEGIQIDQINHSNSLSIELAELRSTDPISLHRPILITTLSRLTLFFEHGVVSTDRLSIIVLDLCTRETNSLNHHLLAELEPFVNRLEPHVQIVILHNISAPVPAALSDLLSNKMESSIRANLGASSTTTTHNPTPSLSASSLSPNPSNSWSSTPPMNVLSQSNSMDLPFIPIQKNSHPHPPHISSSLESLIPSIVSISL